MKTAMYAFSGDPITFGHIDIIKRAAKAFDRVVVGIGVNPMKKYMFSLKERTEMAEKVLSGMDNVKVVSFRGLLVDYAYEHNIDVIVKGVRNSVDFNYEDILRQVGESQKLGIDTHILFAKPELAHISSSTVKFLQKEQGLIHESVPLYVKECLEARMSNQFIVGVTGEVGAGKSFVCREFEKLGKKIKVYNIELDIIGHQILKELKEPRYEHIREKIIKTFGSKVKKNGMVDTKVLGEIVFNNPDKLVELNKLMRTPMIVRLRRELRGKKGLILINAALIAESGLSFLCNNNIILVYTDKETQKKRLEGRNLNAEQIKRRVESQFDFKEKKKTFENIIKRDNQGKLWIIDNSKNSIKEIKNVFRKVLKEIKN
ncbi:MAG: pantetheine-phosphate adenylyltransferase [archaeon]